MAKIKISIGEGLTWLMGKLHDNAQQLIPDADQLEILTTRFQSDVATTRAAYHTALSAVCEIEDPEHPTEGTLPSLKRKLARREEQGQAFASELATKPGDERSSQLTMWLKQADIDCSKTEQELKTAQQLLATRKETCTLRKSAYDAARADLQRLKEVGQTILAETQALDDAQKDKLAAMAATGKAAGSQAGAFLDQMIAKRDKALAANAATDIMVTDETDENPDLDKIAEQEEAARHSSDRISRWMSGATATTPAQ